MRRLVLALGLALTLVVPMSLPAVAAFLHDDHQGTECAEGFLGTLHFVANQTEGSRAGKVVVLFQREDGSTFRIAKDADKRNRNVQHFDVPAENGVILVNARSYVGTSDMPGKLVLSDHTCAPDKKKS